MRRLTLALLFALSSAPPIAAQGTERLTTLTLDEALSLAKRYNPTYLEEVNNQRVTALSVRSAYAAFFPSVSSSMGFSWREGKQTFYEGVPIGAATNVLASNYGIGVNVGYSMSSILQPKRASAQVDAADATVVATEQDVRQQVTVQYFTAVQAVRNAELQDSLVASQQLQFQLAEARERIGSGISLDTKNAEVAVRRQELVALRAHNAADIEKIRLFEFVGVPAPLAASVSLTTDLPVTEPTFKLADLLADMKTHNATLAANRANERAAAISKRQANGSYVPSIGMQTGFGGQTSMFTNATGSARTWPFTFDRNPLTLSLGVQLPLWDGFRREQNTQSSALALTNAQHEVRRVELQLTTSVTSLYTGLMNDWRTVQLQIQIVETARQALLLARERYRVGSTAYTEFALAQDRYQQEENARLVDIYTYHRTFAQLEAAVGRPLR